MTGKVAIIKTGRFETFSEEDDGSDISLGDVVRTTPLLALFPDREVHWFTSGKAVPLLRDNPGIARVVLMDDGIGAGPLDFREFDEVVNLERSPAVLRSLTGFSLDKVTGFLPSAFPLIRSADGRSPVGLGEWKRRLIGAGKPLWQQWLYALRAEEWSGQPYLMKNPAPEIRHDVGLNWRIGKKWPAKQVPLERWEMLASILEPNFDVGWQEGFNDLDQYIAWIASCRALVTHDSLGMHLALALGKKVIAFFGATAEDEVFLYGQGETFRLSPKETGPLRTEDRKAFLAAIHRVMEVSGDAAQRRENSMAHVSF